MSLIHWIQGLLKPRQEGNWKVTWLPNSRSDRGSRRVVPEKVQSGGRKGRQLNSNWLKHSNS